MKAAPTSSIRMGLDLRLTSDRITAPVTSPATSAAIGRAMPGKGSRKATMVATAREAPAETPINSGPAKGLRRVSCITAPEAPSMAPATTPPTTRGSRRLRTMNWRLPSDSEPNTASRTSPTDRSGVPCMSETRATTTHRAAMTANTPAARIQRFRYRESLT